MNVKERIQLLKIIEKMEEYPEYSKKVGLKDISKYQFRKIGKQRKKYDE